MDAFAGIDVAFAKRKALPICLCVWESDCLVPLTLTTRDLPTPPRGSGNAASCDPLIVTAFADETARYLRIVERHFGVSIRRIAIDAPSAPKRDCLDRRLAEDALGRQRISCFATPSNAGFDAIRCKVRAHLSAGGQESRLPHANQLWMQVGFALFNRLQAEWECLEVYPQATMRMLDAGSVHKSKAGGAAAQLQAISRHTGWPNSSTSNPLHALMAAVRAPGHDAVDAYASAWVAALDVERRYAFGAPPDDVIWVPLLPSCPSGLDTNSA
jgi:hypothetical protein